MHDPKPVARTAALAALLAAALPLTATAQQIGTGVPPADPAKRLPSDPPPASVIPAAPVGPRSAPSPQAPPADATGTVVLNENGQEVRIHSLRPNSVMGDYRIDFAALDGNGDGRIGRSEAAANATLTAEFDAVDGNRDGRLDRDELAGWLR